MVAAKERFGRMPRAIVMLVVLLGAAGAGQAADRFVSTAGNDTANDCLSSAAPCRTIPYAVTQSANGDTVKIAGGTYPGTVTIDFSTVLIVSGGWSGDFTGRDPVLNETIVRPPTSGVILAVDVFASFGEVIDVTLEGISFRGTGRLIETQSGHTASVMLAVVNCSLKGARCCPDAILAASSGNSSTTISVADSTISHFQNAIAVGSADASSLALTVTNSLLSHNRGNGLGLGIGAFSDGSSALSISLSNSTVSGNGRGMNLVPLGTSSLTTDVTSSSFLRNRPGGGIYMRTLDSASLNLTLTNVALRSNRRSPSRLENPSIPPDGGAIFVDGASSLTLTNATLSANRAVGEGGGIAARHGTVDLTNTILWRNKAASGADIHMEQSSPGLVVNADHCDIGDRVTVSGTFNDLGGNINADPLLLGDFHLRAGSPCIDAGTCTGAPATDFEGDPRPTGAGCDMGADEFVP